VDNLRVKDVSPMDWNDLRLNFFREGWLPTAARESRRAKTKIGGGGGIRTRVRKHIPAGIYDAYPLLKSRSRREEAAKTAGNQPQKISPLTSRATVSSQPA
jgi:hypothetical protein